MDFIIANYENIIILQGKYLTLEVQVLYIWNFKQKIRHENFRF